MRQNMQCSSRTYTVKHQFFISTISSLACSPNSFQITAQVIKPQRFRKGTVTDNPRVPMSRQCPQLQLRGAVLAAPHSDNLVNSRKELAGSLTTPPPKERSQLPIRVFATMRGIVSGSAQPAASTAIARCAKGILSSLIRICGST